MVSERVRLRREAVAEMVRAGRTVAEIAEATGGTRNLVYEDLLTLGLKAPRPKVTSRKLPNGRGTTEEQDRERRALLAPLAARGLSTHEIAAEVGLPVPKVREILVHLGIETVPHERFHGTTPRVAARRAVVARMVQEGKTTREISEAIGEGAATVRLDRKALGIESTHEGLELSAHATTDLAVSVTELMLAGMTVDEVAHGLRVPVAVVEAIVVDFDVLGALRDARSK